MSVKKMPFGEINAFHVVVESPKGEQKKYSYDPELDAIKLSEVLYDGLVFPFNYGFVAGTENHDGRHLDAFVISTHPLRHGTVATCRAIGMLEMEDRGKLDHKIIAVPNSERRLIHLQDIGDFPQADKDLIVEFYKTAAEQWDHAMHLRGFVDKAKAKKELFRTQLFE